uniref:Protein phosphatase 1 regulatory subunit 14 n=1 Tax=Prolemur simus TaxID=1328070 RepID=A0A8C8YIT7_PROSS
MADSGPAGGAALAARAPGPGSGGPGPRVYFQSPPGAAGEGPGGADDEGPVRRQGKVTVKYDRKELRKRLNLEEWILEQLTRLYDCQEEEIPELEIDVDELLDMESDDTRAARVKELLVDCYKPTEAFISGLLDKIRGMQKLSTPQKKTIAAPQPRSNSNTGDPAARPGAMSRAPRAPGPGASSPAPSVFHFWGFLLLLN